MKLCCTRYTYYKTVSLTSIFKRLFALGVQECQHASRNLLVWHHLFNIMLTMTSTALLFALSSYCSSLLLACSLNLLLNKHQTVQNAAARFVCKARKSDYIYPIFYTLHWLPIASCIQYTISITCYDTLPTTAPQFLSV